MSEISCKAYAKLNISLDITGRRKDGFHDMAMVMQTVSLCDEITISLNDSGRITAGANLPYIPGDDRNLCVKAVKMFLSAVGDEKTGASITLRKSIPVGAGMGGGSADAAAVLRAMNAATGNPLDRDKLYELSGTVGSDVPFCLMGGTAFATGRGEKLTPLPPMPDCVFLICKPPFSISTPELFKSIDRIKLLRHPDTNGIISSIESGNLDGICRRMYNVFEDADDRRMRTIRSIKSSLLDFGAKATVMTGTGSAVFGILPPDCGDLSDAVASLKKEYGFAATATPVPSLLT